MKARHWQECEATCQRVLDALDWAALGEIYFHWGGVEFWQERRPQVLVAGFELARQLLRRVPTGGSSLWVGAGVAELPVLLAETMIQGRKVRATNLRARECEVLNAALQQVAPMATARFEAIDAAQAATDGGYDHLGCISVLTDPETWPLLSDVAYGRIAPIQIDLEQFVRERELATALTRSLFAALRRPGWITTTAEEVAWFLDTASRVEASCVADDDMIETAVVGDPAGFLRIG
ncbi:MAG: hypothetical protein IPK26_22885 [Planctomycetes bacterium]|nr:hypothetical protein [Planctomycetota bacterium]